MTTILIARHGNTFDPGDTVLRLGTTDLPLSNSGKLQAAKLGLYIKNNNINLSAVFTSYLTRTVQTASIALNTAGINLPIQQKNIFNEIDYGPDEAQPEINVIARLGKPAIDAWDQHAIVPPGWIINPEQVIKNWRDFALQLLTEFPDQTVLVVTSNGIARFAPYLTDDFVSFSQNNNIKLSTGALCEVEFKKGRWNINFWNKKIV